MRTTTTTTSKKKTAPKIKAAPKKISKSAKTASAGKKALKTVVRNAKPKVGRPPGSKNKASMT